MKKVMRALVAVPVLVGLAAVPAIAEERLNIGGEMRVRGWTSDVEVGDADNVTRTWADQRMRLAGKFNIAEGVKVIFRMDATESDWGKNPGFGSGRLPKNDTMQWDRAYMELDKGMVQFRGGLIFTELSPSAVVNAQDEGLQLAFNNEAAPFKFFMQMLDDNFAQGVEGAVDGSDAFLFGAGVKPVFGAVSTEFFGAYQNEYNAPGEAAWVIGAAGAFNAGMFGLSGEIDFFGGDASDDVSAKGIQGFVAADFAVTEAAKLQAAFWYAAGYSSADEAQYVYLGNDFAGFDPVWEMGTKLSNEAIALGRPFDWTGTGAGVIGFTLKAFTNIGEAAKAGATIGYLQTEDDAVADADAWALGVGGSYALMDNTSIHAQIQYLDGTINDADLKSFEAGLGIFVNF